MVDTLQESKSLLVRRWGEMGGYWGINRTMAEVYALMFVSTQPLCTDDVMAQLHVSRGNASMNLRALVDWGLIRRVHKLGQRREFFEADADVWHMFETITRERRRREVEPIIQTVDRCRELVANLDSRAASARSDLNEYRRRLDDLKNFLSTMSTLFELVLSYNSGGNPHAARAGGAARASTGALEQLAALMGAPAQAPLRVPPARPETLNGKPKQSAARKSPTRVSRSR